MFVTLNQFFIFIACVSFGGVMGLLYSPTLLLREKFGNKLYVFIFELIFYLFLAFAFFVYSFIIKFHNLRGYMIVGVFIGIYLYVKSFHYMLAKFIKRYYNKIDKFLLRKKIDDRRKGKKTNRSVNSGGGIASFYPHFGHGLRNHSVKSRTSKRQSVRAKNH